VPPAVSRDWPARRQLLASLLAYVGSDRFAPEVEVTPAQLAALFFETRVMARLGARVSVDVAATGTPAANLVDGDPDTFWATPRTGPSAFPHEITIVFERPVPLAGLVIMAQQRDRKRLGEIKDYRVEVSRDGRWLEVARGVLEASFEPQHVAFREATSAPSFRLTALTSHDGGNLAALAEIAAVLDEPRTSGNPGPTGLPSRP
jgi:hypothetical protein